jgi:hypothetical protein
VIRLREFKRRASASIEETLNVKAALTAYLQQKRRQFQITDVAEWKR